MNDSVSTASSQDTSRKIAQSNHTAPDAGHEDMCLQGAHQNSKATSHIKKNANFRRTARAMKLAKKCGRDHKTNHSSHTRTTNVYIVPAITNLMIAPSDNNTSEFANTSHTSQQSQSTVGITTPTLPVTNPTFQHNFQHLPPINQQLNYQV